MTMWPEYQNIFTQVQVQAEPEMGMDDSGEMSAERTKSATLSTLVGILGNAQLGPIYLGFYWIISLATGLLLSLIHISEPTRPY